MTKKQKRPSKNPKGRVSVPGSKGSLTIEAALTLPLFFFAVLSLVCLLEIQVTQLTIRFAAQSAAKLAAQEAAVIPILNPVKLKNDMVKLIGAKRLEQSVIKGGSSGVSCWRSYYDQKEEVLHINVSYKIQLPFPVYVAAPLEQELAFQIKAWTGFKKQEVGSDDEEIVYITDDGWVYHNDRQCTYLQFTVRFIPLSAVKTLRSTDGGIYYACEKCVRGEAMAGVYITDRGESYHNSLDCSGLKRYVRAVRRSEIAGRRECSRCRR